MTAKASSTTDKSPLHSLGVIILCAGASSRLGQAKQHIRIGDQTLLDRAVQLALALNTSLRSSIKPLVISGAHAAQDIEVLRPLAVDHHTNHEWKKGMTSSLALGLRQRQHCSGVFILLVDQYRLELPTLLSLAHTWSDNPQRPVASSYADTCGPPVIWPADYFLQLIETDSPKALLEKSTPNLVQFAEGQFDLDTPSDLAQVEAFFAPLVVASG